MNETGEKRVMMASLGKKLRSYHADKNSEEKSWPKNINRADKGHNDE